jgi:hypothetical protein
MFIGPVYNISNLAPSTGGSVPATMVQYKSGTNAASEILRASLTQGSNTTSTQCLAILNRKTTAATVTAATAGTNLFKQNGANPTTDATLATSGTGITATVEGTNGEQPWIRGFNSLNGVEYLSSPEERIMVAQVSNSTYNVIGLTLANTALSANWVADLKWRELRGA